MSSNTYKLRKDTTILVVTGEACGPARGYVIHWSFCLREPRRSFGTRGAAVSIASSEALDARSRELVFQSLGLAWRDAIMVSCQPMRRRAARSPAGGPPAPGMDAHCTWPDLACSTTSPTNTGYLEFSASAPTARANALDIATSSRGRNNC
ncbi:hypothetical protein HPB51_001310 [Rhipicephalus microplus]|uniref:Uncharacterized protein n=1 Tax=Rhipicephalus microplus TaxID=6941 RepID=A0A9J6DXN9_RHIMP|nr:hypothetical protein HPB51_001310 [Rhipicephalus microplus]